MSQSRNPLALVIGAAVATGALAGPLFSMDAMAHGYLQDPPKAAASEGKCGEGKCGAGMHTLHHAIESHRSRSTDPGRNSGDLP